MEEYTLLSADSVSLLPATGEAEAAIEVFCQRTMMLFSVSEVESVCIRTGVPAEGKPQDCLEWTAADLLLRQKFCVRVPMDHPDYRDFVSGLAKYRSLDALETKSYSPGVCDHTGGHHLHK